MVSSVRHGDTLRLHSKVLDKKLSSKGDRGVVTFQRTIVKQDGGLHVLVNNAGITKDGLLMRMTEEDWDSVIDTNLKSAFNFAKAAIRPMMSQRSGKIINITSVVGLFGNAGPDYAPPETRAAAAVIDLALSLTVDYTRQMGWYLGVQGGYRKMSLTVTLKKDYGDMEYAGIWFGGVIRY